MSRVRGVPLAPARIKSATDVDYFHSSCLTRAGGVHGRCPARCMGVLLAALIIFLGLTLTAKTTVDRAIYGALALAGLAALIYYRQVPALSGWFF